MKLFQLLPKKLYDFACNLPHNAKGRVYAEDAFIETSEIVCFQGNRATLKNGETIELSDGLATALRDYCAFFLKALHDTPRQA